jgi:hypothetical protein
MLLYHLLLEPSCRRSYEITLHRQETLIRVLPLLTDLVIDQLPPLENLARAIHEVQLQTILPASAPHMASSSRIQTVHLIYFHLFTFIIRFLNVLMDCRV